MKDALGHGSAAHQSGVSQIGVTQMVPINSIHASYNVLDPNRPRFAMQQANVDYQRKLIRSGAPMDPLLVTKNGAVLDGHHRLLAYQAEGKSTVPVQVMRSPIWDKKP